MNTESSFKYPLVLIAGPTASGKSALAMAVARLGDTTIINADASQVYRDLRIMSARPTVEEEAEVPHRLFGHVDGAHACSAAGWATDAKAAIENCWAEGQLPIVVGGTGLYIRTLLDGIAPVPEIDPVIRDAVRALNVVDAYAALRGEDAVAADRLHARDTTRVARALEVVRSTGRPLSHWQQQRVDGISMRARIAAATLLPDRDWLFARCDARFLAMIDQGGVGEVEALLARQLNPALPVMRAIGVREIAEMIAHPERRDDCIKRGQIATRQFAKRQFTWFRNQPSAGGLHIAEQLNDYLISKLAIKLYQMRLTA